MSNRNEQVIRIFNVIKLLQAHPRGITIQEIHRNLSQDAQVSERTVRRDIDALVGAHFNIENTEIESETGAKVTSYKLRDYVKSSPTLVLSPAELLALYFARGVLAPLKDTALFLDLTTLFEKIDNLVDAKSREVLLEVSNQMHFEPLPKWSLSVDPDTLDTLRAACYERQILQLQYASANSNATTHRKLGPHFLYFAKASLYLVAEDLADKTLKTFAVPRMSNVQMTQDPYEKPQVDPEQFFSNGFGLFRADEVQEISLKFVRPIADYIKERRWHHTQRVVNLSGGAIQLTMQTGVTPELVQWVLSFGEHVHVESPSLLRQKLTEAATKILRQYKKDAA